MITDEQLRITCKAFYGKHIQPDCCCDEELQVIRRTLEAYEQSKWVKFDVNDESTWPQRKGHHIACDGRNVFHKYWDNTGDRRFRNNSWFVADSVLFKKVTHWQPLPEFKE